MTPTMFFFLKFCKERVHAEEFVSGNLYFRKLSYFQALEDGDDGRGDRFEGVSHLFQPNPNLVIKFGDIKIDPAELVGPVLLTRDTTLDDHALCVYVGSSGPFESLSQENLESFRLHMRVPEQCGAMGEHLVLVHNVTAFQERLLAAAKRENYALAMGSVEYFDETTHSGAIPQPGFWKPRRFAWQRERRFRISTRGRMPDPGRLEVGNLGDIATIVPFAGFNEYLRFDLPEPR